MRITIDSKGINQSHPEEATTLTISGTVRIKPNGSQVSYVGGIILGTYGNPSTNNSRSGSRPAASSVPVGTMWVPMDDRVFWVATTKPNSTQMIWVPSSAPSARTAVATITGSNAVASHFGNYDPLTSKFMPVTASGQLANATAGTSVNAGLSGFAIIFPAAAAMGIPSWTGAVASEFMTDATGSAIPYVNNGTNIPFGLTITPPGVVTTLAFLMYEY